MNEKPQDTRSLWEKLERFLLLLTFACTLLGTVYAIRTSRIAIQQAHESLRPWIAVQDVLTVCLSNRMDISVIIENIGSVPAFVSSERSGDVDGKSISPPLGDLHTNRNVYLPGQKITLDVANVHGDEYQRLLTGQSKSQLVTFTVTIRYGRSADDMPYLHSKTLECEVHRIPEVLASQSYLELWRLVRSDFK